MYVCKLTLLLCSFLSAMTHFYITDCGASRGFSVTAKLLNTAVLAVLAFSTSVLY